jgi:hypothetical protein
MMISVIGETRYAALPREREAGQGMRCGEDQERYSGPASLLVARFNALQTQAPFGLNHIQCNSYGLEQGAAPREQQLSGARSDFTGVEQGGR